MTAWRRATARLLAVALLLPMLLGVIPKTPLSPEEALAQAITQSVCTPFGDKGSGKLPIGHDQACVLCSVGCCSAHMGDAPKSPAIVVWQALDATPLGPITATRPADAPSWRSVVVPRAPPLA